MSPSEITDEKLDELLRLSSPYLAESSAVDDSPWVPPSGVVAAHRRSSENARRRRRLLPLVAPAFGVAMIALVVVGAVQFSHLGRSREVVAASSTPPSSPAAHVQEDFPDGIVATGTFLSPDHSTSGTVEISVARGVGTLTLKNLKSSHPKVGIGASLWSRANDACLDGGDFDWGAYESADVSPLAMPPDFVHGDWTALDEIDLTIFTMGGASNGCFNTIVARAPLKWVTPTLRPWLLTITDTGARDGARGEVKTINGRPISYTVAANDSMDAVARRFGVSVDDLLFLNETRSSTKSNSMLYVDETLNLAVTDR